MQKAREIVSDLMKYASFKRALSIQLLVVVQSKAEKMAGGNSFEDN